MPNTPHSHLGLSSNAFEMFHIWMSLQFIGYFATHRHTIVWRLKILTVRVRARFQPTLSASAPYQAGSQGLRQSVPQQCTKAREGILFLAKYEGVEI